MENQLRKTIKSSAPTIEISSNQLTSLEVRETFLTLGNYFKGIF